MLLRCEERLQEAGYAHYEVSNYARPGRWARHNSLYWVGAEYMGLGVGAHELALLPGGVPARRAGALTLAEYLNAPAASAYDEERLTAEVHLAERLFLGLRTRFGVRRAELEGQFGVERVKEASQRLERLCERGLIEEVEGPPAADLPAYLQVGGPGWVPTRRGLHFANQIALEVL